MTRDWGAYANLIILINSQFIFLLKNKISHVKSFVMYFFMKDYLVFGCTKLPDHSVLLVCNIMQNAGYCEFLIERNI